MKGYIITNLQNLFTLL